jgi:hypothetical protein
VTQVLGILIIKFMKNQMDRKIIKRVKLLTGKNLEFRPMEFGTGTTFIIDGVSKNFPNSLWVEYKQFINYYDIDYISEFTNMIIKEFKLKTNE